VISHAFDRVVGWSASHMPTPVRRGLQKRRVRWGTLRRTAPFSQRYGFDRGQPIDRWMIERFLDEHRSLVRGRVLEVKDSAYTERFGDQVERVDVIDIDASNPSATIVGDLCDPAVLPARAFDCAIVVQTLPYVDDPVAAITNLIGSLAAGGHLLITAPTAARVDPDAGGADRWRFTPEGLDRAIELADSTAHRRVRGSGNLITTIAFLHGLAADELRVHELDSDDPAFPLLAVAVVRRAAPSDPA
jgi:SAM-dependent methyltransferase